MPFSPMLAARIVIRGHRIVGEIVGHVSRPEVKQQRRRHGVFEVAALRGDVMNVPISPEIGCGQAVRSPQRGESWLAVLVRDQ